MSSDISFGKSTLKSNLISFFHQTIVTGVVFGLLASVTATPIYAWWFTDKSPQTAVTPVHHRGLVLSPLVQNILPEFILEPLTTTEEERPPSVEASPSKSSGVVLSSNESCDPQQISQDLISALSQPTSIKEQVLYAVNVERLKVVNTESCSALQPLVANNQLTESAQGYALLMKELNFFSHESPNGTTFKDRNERAGYTNWSWMGENIAYGQQTVDEVVEDWMNSEGHRANILEPKARELGVGYVGGSSTYWVQEFGAQF